MENNRWPVGYDYQQWLIDLRVDLAKIEEVTEQSMEVKHAFRDHRTRSRNNSRRISQAA